MPNRRSVLAVTFLFVSTAANGVQATPQSPASKPELGPNVCVAIRRSKVEIKIGQGKDEMIMTLGGGACEPPGSGISDILLQRAADRDEADGVTAATCPAFAKAVDTMWASKNRTLILRQYDRSVKIGHFLLKDRNGFFNLKSKLGRTEAKHWIIETLEDIRPCWNVFRQDTTFHNVDRIYSLLENGSA